MFEDIGTGTIYGLGLEDYKKRQRHRDHYAIAGKEIQSTLNSKLAKRREKENDVNLDMEPHRSVKCFRETHWFNTYSNHYVA